MINVTFAGDGPERRIETIKISGHSSVPLEVSEITTESFRLTNGEGHVRLYRWEIPDLIQTLELLR